MHTSDMEPTPHTLRHGADHFRTSAQLGAVFCAQTSLHTDVDAFLSIACRGNPKLHALSLTPQCGIALVAFPWRQPSCRFRRSASRVQSHPGRPKRDHQRTRTDNNVVGAIESHVVDGFRNILPCLAPAVGSCRRVSTHTVSLVR